MECFRVLWFLSCVASVGLASHLSPLHKSIVQVPGLAILSCFPSSCKSGGVSSTSDMMHACCNRANVLLVFHVSSSLSVHGRSVLVVHLCFCVCRVFFSRAFGPFHCDVFCVR